MKPAALVLALLTCACISIQRATIHGSGVSMTEERPVDAEFDRVQVDGIVRAEIRVGSAAGIVVRGDDNILPHIRTRVSGGKLVIEQCDSQLHPVAPLVVEITTPLLRSLDAGGATTVVASGVDAQRFDARSSGASSLRIEGRTEDLEARASGASSLYLLALASERADVRTSGASHAEIQATEILDARTSGASDLRYAGSPALSLSMSGASTVHSAQRD